MMVFPTLDEGFGLPVLEAMAVGVPVVCTDLEVLHEVGGDAVEYFPSGDAEELARRIEGLWFDRSRIARNVVAGSERSKLFAWEEVAGRLMGVIRQVSARS